MTSAMAAEIAEIPAVARRLLADDGALRAAAAALAGRRLRFAVICGRGSSGHAGVYLRYLIETRLRVPVAASAPSILTAYGATPAMTDALFVVVSQSGRSPDLVEATRAAAAAGAVTVAIVNDPQSPVARAAACVLPMQAGPEKSVAATKTVAASMIAGAQLVAMQAGDAELDAALARLPERLAAARALDWTAWSRTLAAARAAYVAGRGYALGPVREIALKLGETLRLPALGYSAAELRHGPRAAVTADTPVLMLRQGDATGPTVDALAAELAVAGVKVFSPGAALPWIGDDDPALDPVAMLVPAYRAIEAAAQAAGLDPDRPPHLSKVTETL